MGALRQWYDEYQKTAEWLKQYGPNKWFLTNDQPSLRKLIWTNRDIRVALLPDEYNALRMFSTRLWGDARIVHGRGDVAKIAREMNAAKGRNRVYLHGAGTIQAIQGITVWEGLKQCIRMFASILYFKLRIFNYPLRKKFRKGK